jgi:RNA polymerase sigma-70 factor (ECF subfamily)
MASLDSLNDYELCKLIRLKSDEQNTAFSVIYRRHATTLYRYAFRLCGSRHRSEDLVHDGFVKFHSALEHTDIQQVVPYIVRIIRNQWLDRKQLDVESTQLDTFTSDEVGPENKEQQTMLEDALRQLDETSRDVILMFEVDRMSYQQIADIIGDTPNAVKTRCWRARSKLRSILTPYMEGRL